MALGLLITDLVLAITLMNIDTTEKTVVVPPTIEKPFWVKGTEVAPEYLEEMARYLSSLLLNVTPKSVDGTSDVFLRYVAPNAYGTLKAKMAVQAERLKRSSVATAWYPVEYQTKAKEKVVVVTGDFQTAVGKQVVSSVRRSFRFTYSFVGGRLWVSEFVEVGNEQPFEKALETGTTADASGAQ